MVVSLLCRSRSMFIVAAASELESASGLRPETLMALPEETACQLQRLIVATTPMSSVSTRYDRDKDRSSNRNDLDNAFFSNLRRLPAVAVSAPMMSVKLEWIEQSVRAFDEDGPICSTKP